MEGDLMKLVFAIICFILSGVTVMINFSYNWFSVLFLFLLGIILTLMHEDKKDTQIDELYFNVELLNTKITKLEKKIKNCNYFNVDI